MKSRRKLRADRPIFDVDYPGDDWNDKKLIVRHFLDQADKVVTSDDQRWFYPVLAVKPTSVPRR